MNHPAISADYPFASKFIEIHGAKMHYIEEGEGDPILFLHGNPTSSYLWRNVLPHLIPQGRCIAVDLIGMGKSAKPNIEYRFLEHVQYLEGFIQKMGLKNLTLVIHDWGSALGFHYAMRHEANVKGIAFMEAVIAPAKWEQFPKKMKSTFKMFRTPIIGWTMIGWGNIFIEKVLPMSIIRKLTKKEMDHYRAPYLRRKDRKPLWRWPNEIPIDGQPPEVHKAVESYHQKLQKSDLPKLLIYVHPGAVFPKQLVEWSKANLKNLTAIDVGKGLHFIQEDHPHKIGKAIAEWHQRL